MGAIEGECREAERVWRSWNDTLFVILVGAQEVTRNRFAIRRFLPNRRGCFG